jgi:DNA polymerase-4
MRLNCLFVDFNSFFASVEQQVNPALRGRPVGVVPTMAETTCCIAASYEAKAFGVKTGTIVRDARKLCPGIILVEGHHTVYREFHDALVKTVDSILPVTQVCSIDEMACNLTGRWAHKETALALARKIKETIARDVGPCLRSSIGIAPNAFLAKTATDMQKPDGLVLLDETNLTQRLFALELRDLCGIGENMERRLNRHGIHTVEQLWHSSAQKLRLVWGGIEGERFHAMLHGEPVPVAETNRSLVSHSHVLPPEKRTDPGAEAVLHRLLQKAATRLRRIGYLAGTMGVKVKYIGGGRWYDEIRFLETDDTLELVRLFTNVWQRRPLYAPPPFWVGVFLMNLQSRQNATLRLLETREASRKRHALNRAMDHLNERFGKNTVYYGGMHGATQAAPMRIAFNHIPDKDD